MTKSSVFGKQYQSQKTDAIIEQSGSKFTAKVFLYMFFALALTAATTIASTAILEPIFLNGNEEQINSLVIIALILGVCFIPLFIWIQVSILKGGKGLKPAFIIYSAFVGIFLSPLICLVNIAGLIRAVWIAFGLTCGSFAVMALIAWTSKKNLSNLALVGFGLLFGIVMISLVSLLIGFISDTTAAYLTAVVSLMYFAFVIIITIVDLSNIRSIAARGEASDNIALVCAFSLYTDFVYIFIRVLYFLIRIAAIFGRRK